MLYKQFFDGPGLLCAAALCANVCAAQVPISSQVDELQSLRQQERERAQREQLEPRMDVRLEPNSGLALTTFPAQETPCFSMATFELKGEQSDPFQWALQAPRERPTLSQGPQPQVKGLIVWGPKA